MTIENVKKYFFPESQFGGFTRLDTAVAFFSRVNALIKPGDTVLDVGCGRGAYGEDQIEYRRDLRILKGKVKNVIGIDVEDAGANNPYIDEFFKLDADAWPIESSSIDLIVCDFVMEHLEDPDYFFKEANRVLRIGGYLCIRTPNKWSYVAIIANVVPNRLHSKVINKVQLNRKVQDVFPTHYRCNTKRTMLRKMSTAGFLCAVQRHEPDPRYFNFSKTLYFIAVLVAKITPSMFKTSLFGFGKKTGSGEFS